VQQQPDPKQPEYAKGAFTMPVPNSGGDKLIVLVDEKGVFRGLLVAPPHTSAAVREASVYLLDLMEQAPPSAPNLRII
jgi:hypothetical protein